MTKKLFSLLALCCLALTAAAQSQFGEKPKLVVGIVVDQMRWDYLDRYYDRFCEGGFRRMIDEGFSADNCLINYVPTVTAIGHTSAYTGTTPAFHGICGNNFYINGRSVVSCQDDSVRAVGSNADYGNRSPRNLLATTIGDQLRLHTDFRSRVIGVSYKDRAAIFPAGHSANAAYWLDTKALRFISSTYYMEELPQYVRQVNDALKKNKEVQKAGDRIGYTPLCGTVITDMAIAAIDGEQLGRGESTDMLCVSYSETDVIGHEWGTRGQRTDDAYLTLDRDLKRLFDKLDEQVGRGQWMAFLTADHGAAHNWRYQRSHRLPGGPFFNGDFKRELEAYISQQTGSTSNVVSDIINYRIFLDREAIQKQGLDMSRVRQAAVDFASRYPHIQRAVDYEQISTSALPERLAEQLLKGYFPGRSGDIVFIPEPHYYESWRGAPEGQTTHGEWNPYDAHIPCLFLGWKIPHGATSREVHITDIAPTVCQLLHIQQPSACIGEAITEITK